MGGDRGVILDERASLSGAVASGEGRHIPAIDGLRAVAVTTVILFHLWPNLLPGGLRGVDVFFVISGFVVTHSLSDRAFPSFWQLLSHFYARRIVRILPALILLVVLTTLASVLFIPRVPPDNANMRTAFSALLGFSNLVLAGSSNDYFGPESRYNPLTHTWSLGVEEQFYLIFPLIIFLYARSDPKRLGVPMSLVLLCGLSFALFIVLSYASPKIAFYWMFPRFWELGAGVALRLTLHHWTDSVANRPLILPLSALLLLVSLTGSSHQGWAIWYVPMAVVGTSGLIAACTVDKHRNLLSASPVVTVGRLSYSLYLWHWPILVLMRWTLGLSPLTNGLSLALTLIFAIASYRLIERPVRIAAKGSEKRTKFVAAATLAGLAAGLLVTYGLAASRNWMALSVAEDPRYAPVNSAAGCHTIATITRYRNGQRGRLLPAACAPAQSTRTVYALGDSHNQAYVPAYDRFVRETGIPVAFWSIPGCPLPQINAVVGPRDCPERWAAGLAEVTAKARRGDLIFLPGLRIPRFIDTFGEPIGPNGQPNYLPASGKDIDATLARLLATGAQVVLEAPKPIFKASPYRCQDWFNRANAACAAGFVIARDEIDRRRAQTMDEMRNLTKRYPLLTIWDPIELLCDGRHCYAVRNGANVFYDADHLGAGGRAALYESLKRALTSTPAR